MQSIGDEWTGLVNHPNALHQGILDGTSKIS